MSIYRAKLVQPTTYPGAAARWDDKGAEVRSLISGRVFQIQVDAEGLIRSICKDGDDAHEVMFADVIADARDSAALLRAQAQDEVCAILAALVRHALHHLIRALPISVARSSRISGRHRLPKGL
jgi:hypothetical protein